MSDDKGWLKELKAGDKVFVDYFSKYTSTQTYVVQKICDGRIYIDDYTYFIDGVKRAYCGAYSLKRANERNRKIREIKLVGVLHD